MCVYDQFSDVSVGGTSALAAAAAAVATAPTLIQIASRSGKTSNLLKWQ